MDMRDEYDFSNAASNPYASILKSQSEKSENKSDIFSYGEQYTRSVRQINISKKVNTSIH